MTIKALGARGEAVADANMSMVEKEIERMLREMLDEKENCMNLTPCQLYKDPPSQSWTILT